MSFTCTLSGSFNYDAVGNEAFAIIAEVGGSSYAGGEISLDDPNDWGAFETSASYSISGSSSVSVYW